MRLVLLLASSATFTLLGSTALAHAEEQSVPSPPPIECLGYDHTLFLARDNVLLRNLRWRVPSTGESGCGYAVPHSEDTGHFWFFGSENLELTCKILDGRSITGRYWLFCGALTDVEWWMDVKNNATPEIPAKTYYNPPGKQASIADVSALGYVINNAPYFPKDKNECGFVARSNTSRFGGGSFSTFVKDSDGDSLTAVVKVLEGDESALRIVPQWKNPIADTSAGTYLLVAVDWPAIEAKYVFTVEVSDGKTLLPSRCIFTIQISGAH